MRKQKRRVVTIGGQQPLLYVGSAAHFSAGHLAVEVVDPPARGRRAVELFGDITSDSKRRFAAAYYGPLIDLLEEEASQNRDDVVMRDLPLADVAVGMSRERFGAIRDYIRGDREDVTLGSRRARDLSPQGDLSRFVGGDDVLVQLGVTWNEASMRLQPRERVG